ncbi:hypothetical protein PVAND_002640 [Polypedilum vanderplanki]|uniref:Enhancer of split malpha protein n=1 Tax=Polypedilum vanderplanki TaxID=319348 RepID=A0A9J6BSB7_POLVA|nr:hypothetical protein PVAND_002640 [Polypedilum vanderplanki]
MSIYSSEYSMSSINSINENIYNTQKQQKSSKYRLKKIFKKITEMLLQRKNKKIAKSQHACQKNYDYSSEINDNDSNETLETRIFDEIKQCNDNSAVYIFGNEEHDYLMQVERNQTYVPVHFARTEGGTFFWTSFNNQAYCHQENLPNLSYHRYDRWIQA